MADPAPLYTTMDSVRVRLANKVQFQTEDSDPVEGEMPDTLLLQLVIDAESSIESSLRGRYAIPFQSKSIFDPPLLTDLARFEALPDHTKRQIRMLVDMQAVLLVLETDFGRGTHIDGDPYKKSLEDRLEKEIKKILGQDMEGESKQRFRFAPPLDDLALAASNSKADDGYRGRIINTDGGRGAGGYASGQINDPGYGVFPSTRRIY